MNIPRRNLLVLAMWVSAYGALMFWIGWFFHG